MSRPFEVAEVGDGIYSLQLNSSDGTNSFGPDFLERLRGGLGRAASHSNLRVLLIRGNRSWFSSGASRETLRLMASGTFLPEELIWPRELLSFHAPIYAVAEGHALGGGFALALACDFIYLAREARYGCNFMRVGLTPGNGSTSALTELIGSRRGLELLLTGDTKPGSWWELRADVQVDESEELWARALRSAGGIAEKPRALVEALLESSRDRRKKAFEAAFENECRWHKMSLENPEAGALMRDALARGDANES